MICKFLPIHSEPSEVRRSGILGFSCSLRI